MSLKIDAAYLAGFIVGSYDIRGDAAIPAHIKPFIDRVLNAPDADEIKHVRVPDWRSSKESYAGENRVQDADESAEHVQKNEEIEQEQGKRKYSPIPKEKYPEVCELYKAGMSAGKIVEKLGIGSPSTIYKILAGVERRERPGGRAAKHKEEAADDDAALNDPEPMEAEEEDSKPATGENDKDKAGNDMGYIGTRADGVLGDDDWPDIKKMMNNGAPRTRIASSYDVEEDYLDRFIEKMQKLDQEGQATRGNY